MVVVNLRWGTTQIRKKRITSRYSVLQMQPWVKNIDVSDMGQKIMITELTMLTVGTMNRAVRIRPYHRSRHTLLCQSA